MSEPYPVSDHYLIRWMERSIGIDMDGMRKMAWLELGPDAQAAARTMSNGAVRLPDGAKAIWKGGVLVTYLAPDRQGRTKF